MAANRSVAGILLIVATVCGASIAAAQRATDTPGSTTTVAGCIQRTDQPGTLGATIPDRNAAPESVGTAGNLGEAGPGFVLIEAPSATTGKRFILFGSEGELATHEGHRVQVSGTLEPSTKPAESGATGTSGSNQVKSTTERLKVTSVEMIAGDCSAS